MNDRTEPAPVSTGLKIALFATLLLGVRILPLVFARLGFGLYTGGLLSGLVVGAVCSTLTLKTARALPMGHWSGALIGATGTAMVIAFGLLEALLRAPVI